MRSNRSNGRRGGEGLQRITNSGEPLDSRYTVSFHNSKLIYSRRRRRRRRRRRGRRRKTIKDRERNLRKRKGRDGGTMYWRREKEGEEGEVGG